MNKFGHLSQWNFLTDENFGCLLWQLPSEQGKACGVHGTCLKGSLQCMPHLPSSGLRKCLLFWWLLQQGAVLAIGLVNQCGLIGLQCHSNCYHVEAMSGWTLSDLLALWPLCSSQWQSSQWCFNPLSFLLSCWSQSSVLLLFGVLTPSKGWSNRLVHIAMCFHIASHAIPSQHVSPHVPSWEFTCAEVQANLFRNSKGCCHTIDGFLPLWDRFPQFCSVLCYSVKVTCRGSNQFVRLSTYAWHYYQHAYRVCA